METHQGTPSVGLSHQHGRDGWHALHVQVVLEPPLCVHRRSHLLLLWWQWRLEAWHESVGHHRALGFGGQHLCRLQRCRLAMWIVSFPDSRRGSRKWRRQGRMNCSLGWGGSSELDIPLDATTVDSMESTSHVHFSKRLLFVVGASGA